MPWSPWACSTATTTCTVTPLPPMPSSINTTLLHRRDTGDAQRPPVSILGFPYRGTTHRATTKREPRAAETSSRCFTLILLQHWIRPLTNLGRRYWAQPVTFSV